MTRTFKYALSAILGAAIAVPALAQDQFPDVPANHWAFKDLSELKTAGLLVGYPDGLFRGGRPASRYELAVAIHAVWANLKAQQDALKGQIDDLAKRMDNVATKSDLDALRSQIEALQTEVGRIKSEDIAKLNRLIDEFKGDLARLGADVNGMKADLKALEGRVIKIEGRLPNFDVSGDLNAVALGGYSSSDRNGVTVDDRPTGVGRGSYAGTTVGVDRDLTFLHEAAFTVVSHNDNPDAPKFKATGVFGNMLGGGFSRSLAPAPSSPVFGGPFGNQSDVFTGSAFSEGSETFYFQEFNVAFKTSVAGLKFNAQVGRVGYQVSPYIFKRQDTTPYFANERWDNGDWTFDGGILGFQFGKAKFDVFGGRTSALRDSSGNQFQAMGTGRDVIPFVPGDPDRPRGYNGGFSDTGIMLPVDQFLGTKLSMPLGGSGALNLSYIWLDSNTVINTGTSIAPKLVNGTAVYGGDITFDFHGVKVDGSYAKSDERYNGRNVSSTDDAAWAANLTYAKDKWGVKGGYRRIEPLFSAPGDWGRIGIWWNPTDIKGWNANLWYDLNPKVRLSASGEWYTGTDTTRYGFTGLSNDDKVSRYVVGLEYKLATNYNLALGYEDVEWNLANRAATNVSDAFTGGKPHERWYNVGFGFDLGNRAKLSVLWQISDYDGKNLVGWNPFGSGSDSGNGTKATGGLITTQLTIKF